MLDLLGQPVSVNSTETDVRLCSRVRKIIDDRMGGISTLGYEIFLSQIFWEPVLGYVAGVGTSLRFAICVYFSSYKPPLFFNTRVIHHLHWERDRRSIGWILPGRVYQGGTGESLLYGPGQYGSN